MKRIIIHWTAGLSSPNSIEKNHYHFLIDSNGGIHNGNFKPENNENCNDGKYAAHTGGGNTGSIGVALCGMYGFTSPNHLGNDPLTKIQCESLFKFCAKLSKKYAIPITTNTILTHYEFGLQHPTTSSKGKIDIIYLPPYPNIKKENIGNFIRNKIKWYISHL